MFPAAEAKKRVKKKRERQDREGGTKAQTCVEVKGRRRMGWVNCKPDLAEKDIRDKPTATTNNIVITTQADKTKKNVLVSYLQLEISIRGQDTSVHLRPPCVFLAQLGAPRLAWVPDT